jgi:hypothetical protein
MYVKTFVKSALIATILFGLSMGAAPDTAEAGDFYTRKRVNGVWITGQFPKKHVIRAKEARNQMVVAAAAAPSMPSSSPSTLGEELDRPPLFQHVVRRLRPSQARVRLSRCLRNHVCFRCNERLRHEPSP